MSELQPHHIVNIDANFGNFPIDMSRSEYIYVRLSVLNLYDRGFALANADGTIKCVKDHVIVLKMNYPHKIGDIKKDIRSGNWYISEEMASDSKISFYNGHLPLFRTYIHAVMHLQQVRKALNE